MFIGRVTLSLTYKKKGFRLVDTHSPNLNQVLDEETRKDDLSAFLRQTSFGSLFVIVITIRETRCVSVQSPPKDLCVMELCFLNLQNTL